MKDYNNLIAVLAGTAVILLCVFIYYLSQLYFKSRANQEGKKKKP